MTVFVVCFTNELLFIPLSWHFDSVICCLFDRLRIVVRSDSLGLVVSLNSSNSCHSEKTENLASSVDFRLIQNLSMLIEVSLSATTLAGWVPRLTVTTAVYTADTNLVP